jgi:predicted  nucleic acid-binding Zn-ribbon protein
MKKGETPTDKVKRLDAEIETEETKAKKLAAELDERAKERGRLQTRCSVISYNAKADGDPAAVTELRDLRQRLRENDDETVDLQTAITETARRLDALRAERADAFRDAMKAAYWSEMEKVIEAAEDAEFSLQDLLIAKGKISERLDKLNAIVARGEFEGQHGRLLRNLWRCVQHRLGLSDIWFNKEAKEVFSKPIDMVFKLTLHIDDENKEQTTRKSA